jgi:predicted nuclease of restriction endonuclease-like (RecB) superfamily
MSEPQDKIKRFDSQQVRAAPRFFTDVAQILQTSRSKAYRAVNTAMIQTYWQLGQRIVEEEQQGEARAVYGQDLMSKLSRYLGEHFGQGFSVANLKNFRQFYLTFPSFDEFATHCVANIAWSHVRLIMRLDSTAERHYYLQEASSQNWSSRLLERNIKSGYYRRVLAHQSPLNNLLQPSASPFIKDPYVLEFLGLPENLSGKENRLEQSLINHLQQFLLELGKGFSFVARQMRISTETSHFYVDLVFYNYLLKCFVVIDLKTEKLTHQDIGQMDMYVRMFDDLKRGEGDNPTLGIILCADKDETLVHYSVLSESQQLFASKYQTLLPTEEELAAMLKKETVKRMGNTEDNATGGEA